MEISFEKKSWSYQLKIVAENVLIEEDVDETTYPLNAEGKKDFTKRPDRDVSTNVLKMLANLLNDAIFWRDKDFDSSLLIYSLFEKLPAENAEELITKLCREYGIFPQVEE